MATEPEIYDKSVHAGYTVLARKLQELFPEKGNVSRQKVHTWASRRSVNGFPESLPVIAPSGKIKNLFYLKDVVSWYFGYKSRTKRGAISAEVDN